MRGDDSKAACAAQRGLQRSPDQELVQSLSPTKADPIKPTVCLPCQTLV